MTPLSRRRRSARAALFLVTIAVAAVLASGCGVLGFGHTSPTAGRSAPPGPAAARVRPRIGSGYGGPIANYRVNESATRYRITGLNGIVPLAGKNYFLGFRVQRAVKGHAELVDINLRSWREQHVTPEKYTVDGVTAYRADSTVPGKNGGTVRFYIAAKGAVTVDLEIFAPRGQRISAARRAEADRLFASVRFDEPVLSGPATRRAVQPVVPFTYEKPAGVRPAPVTGAHLFWVTYTVGSESVTVGMDFSPSATRPHRRYVAKKRKLDRNHLRYHDVKTFPPTANGVGKRVDEGYFLSDQTPSGGAILWVLRRTTTLISIETVDQDHRLTAGTKAAVNDVAGNLRFS